jgi:hypothetical protein
MRSPDLDANSAAGDPAAGPATLPPRADTLARAVIVEFVKFCLLCSSRRSADAE